MKKMIRRFCIYLAKTATKKLLRSFWIMVLPCMRLTRIMKLPSSRNVRILPYDKTGVKLKYVEGVKGSDYINASYIPGFARKKEFIATQVTKYSETLIGSVSQMHYITYYLGQNSSTTCYHL